MGALEPMDVNGKGGLRPFLLYYGAKWRAAPHYPYPVHDTIVEPFAGAAGYSLRHFDRNVILIEREPRLAAIWRYLISVSVEEVLALPDVPPGLTVDDVDAPAEARHIMGFWLNQGTTAPSKRASAWIRKRPEQGWGERVRQRIAAQVPYIRHWQVIEGSYEDAPDIEATWYIDPPYQVAGKHYVFGADTLDFDALGDWCRTRRGQVMVCENEGATWLPFRPYMAIQAASGKQKGGPGGKKSAEVLWRQRRER